MFLTLRPPPPLDELGTLILILYSAVSVFMYSTFVIYGTLHSINCTQFRKFTQNQFHLKSDEHLYCAVQYFSTAQYRLYIREVHNWTAVCMCSSCTQTPKSQTKTQEMTASPPPVEQMLQRTGWRAIIRLSFSTTAIP